MKLHWIAPLCLALSAAVAHAGTSKPFELKGSLAFASKPNQYLMVYTSNEISSGPNVYAKVVSSDGTPSGKDIRLSRLTGEMSKPVVSYSSATEKFLVVWSRKLYDEDRAEIIGQLMGHNGKVIGEEFRLTVSTMFDTRPSISYCPGRDRFLVTWTRATAYDPDDGIADIYGQFVASDGSLIGGNFGIASETKNQFKSDSNCNPHNDRLLVVWEDQRNLSAKDDIYGQLMSSDGTMIGGNFRIAGTNDLERRPVVGVNPNNGTYVLVWESEWDDNIHLFTQTMDADGKPLGAPAPIGADMGGSRNRAAISYLEKQDVFLVVFFNSGFNGLSDGIYGQFIDGNGRLRQTTFPLTTANMGQYRADVSAAKNTFLAIWTDYRDTANGGVYEYYGRVIGNDSALSARWKNPDSSPTAIAAAPVIRPSAGRRASRSLP